MTRKILICCICLVLLCTTGCAMSASQHDTQATLAVADMLQDKIHKVDEEYDYDAVKTVEDACRASITSYISDKLIYEQYKDSIDSVEIDYAQKAKMRANNTASLYNNYILANSYVWKDNVPEDIMSSLPYLE